MSFGAPRSVRDVLINENPFEHKEAVMERKPRVLIIVTSHGTLGVTNRPTGLWFEELAAPYYEFLSAGMTVDLASPAGGEPPVDPESTGDPPSVVRRFTRDAEAMRTLRNTLRLAAIEKRYDVYFVAGGHGPMWDLAHDETVAKMLGHAADTGKIVAAVCHGPAALLHAKLANGTLLVRGRRLTGFTNKEEQAVHRINVVPFLLETRLKDLGATFERAEPWVPFVVRDRLLVTGQNPQSAAATARAAIAAWSDLVRE